MSSSSRVDVDNRVDWKLGPGEDCSIVGFAWVEIFHFFLYFSSGGANKRIPQNYYSPVLLLFLVFFFLFCSPVMKAILPTYDFPRKVS